MPAPVITTPEGIRVIPKGVADSLTLTAINTPTSWAATGLPTGLSISSGGVISGTPTATTATSSSITATNGNGTSDAVSIIYVVTDAVTGLAADSFAYPLEWDLSTDKIAIRGIRATAQPAGEPPATGSGSEPLLDWKAGQTMTLSVGFVASGTLRATGVDTLAVYLKNNAEEDGIELTTDSSDVTTTGSGSTARSEVTITIPTTGTIANWFADSETGNRFPGHLELHASVGTETRISQTVPIQITRPLGAIP